MKKFVVMITAFILVGCNSNEENHLADMNLKGNIKSVKEIHFDGREKFGEFVKEDWKYTIEYIFNENGNLIERNSYYSPENMIRDKIKFLYNNNNEILEENKYDSDGNLVSTEKYSYDNSGKKIRKTSIESNKITISEKYIYNNKGQLIEVQNVLTDGSISYGEIFSYNNHDILSEKIEMYRNDDETTTNTINKYNRNGQLVEISFPGSKLTAIKYIYDKNGEIIKQINHLDNGEPNGDTFLTKIKYDEKANWINKITIGNSEWSVKADVRIEEREIEYYN